jgi:hypothetical protein
LNGEKNDQGGENDHRENQDKQSHSRSSPLSSPRATSPFRKQFPFVSHVLEDVRGIEWTSSSRSPSYLLLPFPLQFGFGKLRSFGDELFEIFHLPTQIGFLLSQFVPFGFYGRSGYAFAAHHFESAK